jgi:hypothetical protein
MNNTTFGEQQTGTGLGSFENGRTEAQQHTEGTVARGIEKQTAKLPSDLFLWAAAGAIGVSAALEFSGNHEKSRFVGQWVAPFLLLGVYNKIVKVAGSDRAH